MLQCVQWTFFSEPGYSEPNSPPPTSCRLQRNFRHLFSANFGAHQKIYFYLLLDTEISYEQLRNNWEWQAEFQFSFSNGVMFRKAARHIHNLTFKLQINKNSKSEQ